MRLRQLDSIAEVPAAQWNELFPEHYPFARHEFLDALERHGCAVPATGWSPCHVVLEDGPRIIAAAPLYLKAHSYGEFVFDFAWADASHRMRRPYYPKLLCAVPFTPSSGPRIGAETASARTQLAMALPKLAQDLKVSSFHALFVEEADDAALAAAGCRERNDLQFHWRNRGYADFAEFLSRMSSDKRKKIQRERRRIVEAGLRFEVRHGDELSEAEWHEAFALYASTYEERAQAPYLTLDFFLDYARRPATPVRLILAYAERSLVAVAITLIGKSADGGTLYGRHWGAAERYHSLHFETCYYQGIEWCIREGIQTFDAGAQGEHKLARGFEPVVTRSRHWLADARLFEAVTQALRGECGWVGARNTELAAHSPFRRDLPGGNGAID